MSKNKISMFCLRCIHFWCRTQRVRRPVTETVRSTREATSREEPFVLFHLNDPQKPFLWYHSNEPVETQVKCIWSPVLSTDNLPWPCYIVSLCSSYSMVLNYWWLDFSFPSSSYWSFTVIWQQLKFHSEHLRFTEDKNLLRNAWAQYLSCFEFDSTLPAQWLIDVYKTLGRFHWLEVVQIM